MSEDKYVRALELMLEDLEYPNRELKLMAQVAECQDELFQVCRWLRREIEREISIQTMFD
jgi:hypothetical protein